MLTSHLRSMIWRQYWIKWRCWWLTDYVQCSFVIATDEWITVCEWLDSGAGWVEDDAQWKLIKFISIVPQFRIRCCYYSPPSFVSYYGYIYMYEDAHANCNQRNHQHNTTTTLVYYTTEWQRTMSPSISFCHTSNSVLYLAICTCDSHSEALVDNQVYTTFELRFHEFSFVNDNNDVCNRTGC